MVISAPGGSDGGRQRQIDPGRFKISLDNTVRFWLKQNKTKIYQDWEGSSVDKVFVMQNMGT